MAKLAMINRDLKRQAMVRKFAAMRKALEAIITDASLSDEERYQARLKLQALPRASSPTRLRNRCELTGRPRGTFRKCGLGRNKLREIAMRGRDRFVRFVGPAEAGERVAPEQPEGGDDVEVPGSDDRGAREDPGGSRTERRAQGDPLSHAVEVHPVDRPRERHLVVEQSPQVMREPDLENRFQRGGGPPVAPGDAGRPKSSSLSR
mgnify:CR=1 FL=1